RGHGVLGVDAVARYLAGAAAIRIAHPDLEMTGTVGAPQKLLPIRGQGWIPVVRLVVGQASQGPALGGDRPQVHVSPSDRGEDHPFAVRCVDGLAVGTVAPREPSGGPARERDLAQVLAG